MYLLGLFGPRALWGSWPVTLNADQTPVPLTVFISGSGSIGVWGVLVWVCSADRGAVLHTSRPLHCRGVCKISLWSVGYALTRSASDFGRVSALVRVSLVGQAPELWNLDMYVNSHDQNIFLFFVIVPNLCCSLVVLCHVMLAINCTELNWMIVALLYSRNWNQHPDLLCVIYCIAHHMKFWQASTFTTWLTTHGTNKNVCINTRQHILVIPFCRCGLTHWGLVSSYGVIGLVNSKKAINYYLMAYYQSNPLLQTTLNLPKIKYVKQKFSLRGVQRVAVNIICRRCPKNGLSQFWDRYINRKPVTMYCAFEYGGRFYIHGLILILAWISTNINYNIRYGIPYPFPNSNNAIVEVWKWISKFIPHFAGHVITDPWWDWNSPILQRFFH